jgi:hypothetical protein
MGIHSRSIMNLSIREVGMGVMKRCETGGKVGGDESEIVVHDGVICRIGCQEREEFK